ncbi:F-box protein isoform X1 [Spatholobus suberectus]|nr:F-box protein isoform X1 [Spatholobus suberectus]
MMPDDIAAQACHDGERVEAQAMNGYQSVWMAHWMQTSYKSATPAGNRSGIDCELKEEKEDSGAEQHDLLGGLDSSMHAGAVGEAARATSVTFTNEADNEKSKKASSDSTSFPTFKFSRKLDGRLPLQGEQHGVCHGEDGKSETEPCSGDDNVSLNRAGTSGAGLPSTSALAPPKTETLVKECQVLSQEVLPTAMMMKSPWDVEQKNLTVSTSLWNDFLKSASDMVPSGRGKGKTVMPQFTHEPFEVCQSSYNLASRGRFTSTKYHTFSSLLISEKKMSSLSNAQRSSFSRWMQGGVTHLPHDFIAGSDDGLYFVRGQHHEIEKYVANPSIARQTTSSESTKPQIFYGLNSVVPCSIHDVGSMKIYTSIDSVEESSRGCPKISQTTRHFLKSKKIDVNSSNRGQFFRGPIAPIKFKGNAFNEILDFSPPTSDHALEGLKLEAPGSSIKGEGKENVQDFKCPTYLKNESSAETDTMDINALHKNNLPGDVPLQTNKVMFLTFDPLDTMPFNFRFPHSFSSIWIILIVTWFLALNTS